MVQKKIMNKQIQITKKSVNFEELKKVIFDCEEAKIWIIVGDPGSGKSTTINRLGCDWADLKDPPCTLIIVRLAQLNDIDEKDFKLPTVLKKAIPRLDSDDTLGAEALDSIVEDIYDLDGNKYIFALDGYDEYRLSGDNFISKLIKQDELKNCTVVITSRPYSSIALKKKVMPGFKPFKIAPFDNFDEFAKYYFIDKFKSRMEANSAYDQDSVVNTAQDKAEEVATIVKKDNFLHSLCSLPLHCEMVCSYFDGDLKKTPETRTQLYSFFVGKTVERHYETRVVKQLTQIDSEDDKLK